MANQQDVKDDLASKKDKLMSTNSGSMRSSFSIPKNDDGTIKNRNQITFEDIMTCWPMNEKNFNNLVRITGYNKLVPLVGAGITKNLTKEGTSYPSWRDLFGVVANDYGFKEMEIAELTPKDGEPFDYEKAGQKIENLLGSTALQQKLRELFRTELLDDEKISKSPLSLLPKLKPQVILTTNYDCAIERAYELSGYSGNLEKIMPTTTTKTFAKIFREIDPQINETTILYKFHGDVADEGKTHDLILSGSSYDNVYGTIKEIRNRTSNKDIVRNLYYFLFSKTILFLGCSLTDDRIMQLIRYNAEGEHYAIVACDSNEEAKIICEKLRPLNIRPILYPRRIRESISIIINKLIEMNTAWDIASVCRPKDEWLRDYLIKINRGEEIIQDHIIFFGGIFTGLRSVKKNDELGKNYDYTSQLNEWLDKHPNATIYYCYDSLEIVKQRNSQLDSAVESVQIKNPNEKIKQILKIPKYFGSNQDRIKLIPINYDLNGYAVIMDNRLFWSFKTHERSSKSPIIELDLNQIGSKKFIEYIAYALEQSKSTIDNDENIILNNEISELIGKIEVLSKVNIK